MVLRVFPSMCNEQVEEVPSTCPKGPFLSQGAMAMICWLLEAELGVKKCWLVGEAEKRLRAGPSTGVSGVSGINFWVRLRGNI